MANLKSSLNLRDKGAEYCERSPKWRRVALAIFFIAICYALPFLNNPLINTPGSDFQSVLFYPVGMYVLMAIGLNIDFLGLLQRYDPNLYFGGDNALFFGPMSEAIVYGLVFATFLTLVIVPVMYFLLYKAKKRFY